MKSQVASPFEALPGAEADFQLAPSATFFDVPSSTLTASPLFSYAEEIERALAAELAMAALMMAIALPDLCAALGDPKGVTSGDKYAKWFDENLPEYVEQLPGQQCYKLRCGLLHQGTPRHRDFIYQRPVFALSGARGHRWSFKNVWHDGVRDLDTLMLALPRFCRDMHQAAGRWAIANLNNPTVVANAQRLLRYRPEGVHTPMMSTGPAIA